MLVLAFMLLLTLSFGIVMMLTRPSTESVRVSNRLGAIRNLSRMPGSVARDEDLANKTPTSVSEQLGMYLRRYSFANTMEVLLTQSASSVSLGVFAFLSLGSALTLFVALFLLSKHPIVSLAGGAIAAILPYLWLRRRRNKRLDAFNAALPDTIELMSRALRAGHSVPQMLELIGEQTREPISGEFSQVHQEQKLGVPFRDAMLALSHRVPSQDLHFVVTAILIQKETGGDLTEILDRTSHIIRDRLRVAGEVLTYTAQGRLTGWILSLLPVALLGLVSLITPSYSKILFHDPAGQKLLAFGATMIGIGTFTIRRIVDVEV